MHLPFLTQLSWRSEALAGNIRLKSVCCDTPCKAGAMLTEKKTPRIQFHHCDAIAYTIVYSMPCCQRRVFKLLGVSLATVST